ncbi:hypothetical protein PVAP13_6NG359000 [Panicum virgatum]|uniref:S-acyltransferase n=1 Tax=Panicum virgatum TaxID=38727 RepID=A0A8T0R659_PANVG|nr:hypothetical protein PVAP13_6NG359000 [Panicum virgatum]
MARKHGWQLPAHTLQVVAITVFLLLVVAFYAFFAPFLGKQVLEYVAIGTHTFMAFAVFILYIRCASINPADPGIMSQFEDGFIDAPGSTADIQGTNLPAKTDTAAGTNSPTSTYRSSLDGRSNRGGLAVGDANIDLGSQPPRSSRSCLLGGLVCALFIKEDCRKFDDSENQVDGEDALFCTLCNAEWLNNCVGRKNYFTFLALMTTSLLWLAIEIGVGIAVLVICFTNKNSERIIQDKLGNGLPRPAFATIVAFFTLLSLVACVPLGELFFFHMILIRKGITTYEYVVAMRAMSEAPQEEEDQEEVNIVYSPTNSATTGFSGASSLGLHYKGSWCTPPRIFVDKDEVIPHLEPGMVPSTVDPDAVRHTERANKAKKQVKISAWKLAKLDSNEAMKAAAKARASSSVLRPIDTRRGPGSSLSSSGNASMRSSMSADYSASATKEKWADMKLSSLHSSSYPQSLASQDDYESGTQSASSISSPVRIHKPVPHTQISVPPAPPPPPRPAPVVMRPQPVPTTQISNPVFQSATSYVRENRKASVVWDQEAGRFVSVAPAPTRPGAAAGDQAARAPRFLANPGGAPSNRERNLAPVNASSPALTSGQPSERLTYTGQSIFFGGPLFGAAAAAGTRRSDDPGARARPEERREFTAHQLDTAGERRRTAASFPVFAPGTFQTNPPPFNR